MAYLNENYLKLQAGYLFPEVARRVREFGEAHSQAARRLIRCGIGDVTEPLPGRLREAMQARDGRTWTPRGFRGYGPEQGYDFLRPTIAERDYRARGIEIADDEIFVSDGSKYDCANVLDIRGGNRRLRSSTRLSGLRGYQRHGRSHRPVTKGWELRGHYYLPCTAANDFVPEPRKEQVDLVYLCFPNNPTGAVASRTQLEVGSIMRTLTMPFFSSTRRTRHIFPTRIFRTRSLKFPAHANAPLSFAAFRRMAALPASAAHSR